MNDKFSLECDPGNLTAAIGDGGNDVSMLQVHWIFSNKNKHYKVLVSGSDRITGNFI